MGIFLPPLPRMAAAFDISHRFVYRSTVHNTHTYVLYVFPALGVSAQWKGQCVALILERIQVGHQVTAKTKH